MPSATVTPNFAAVNGPGTGSIIPSNSETSPDLANTAASEPAVLSSDGATQRITNAQTSLQNLSQKGTSLDPTTGTAQYADGSAVPAPAGAVYNPDTGQYEAADGNNYGAAEFYGQDGNTPDPDEVAVQSLFAPLKASLDANTLSQVNAIQQQYTALTNTQKAINASTAKAGANALLLNGTSRYAPLDAASITRQQLSNGLMNIQDLDAKENAAIAAAQAAQQSGDMSLMLDQIKQAETIRTQKQSTATAVQNSISTANQQLQIQQQQQQTDSAVASALSSGMTDPAQILQALNAAGLPVTSDQVAASLKNFATTTGAAGITGLTGDTGNFYKLQAAGALPASILSLPAGQQLSAYISMVNQAKKGLVGTPAGGAPSAGGATSAAASTITGTQMPIVGFDPSNGPNPQDQASFLDSLPGGETGDLATLIKGIADYSINPSAVPQKQYKGVSGLTQQQAVTLAKEYDPSYNSNNYAAAAAMQKSVTSGNYSQAITSANTLIQHLSKLEQDAKGLPDYNATRDIPGVAMTADFFGSSFHNPAINNFNIDAGAVATEAAKIYKSTGAPATTEIDDWQKAINPNMSPGEVQGAVNTIIDLMAGKLSTISTDYQNTMGKPYTNPMLTPQSLSILKSLGIDPSSIDPTYSSASDLGSSSDYSSFMSSGSGSASGTPVNWGAAPVQ